MLVNKNGHEFEVEQVFYDGADFWHKFGNGSWEPRSFELLDRYLRPTNTFVDIGAWIGPLTIYAARHCQRVFAVEPDPVALEHLRKNVAANCDNVTIIEAAIAQEVGSVHLSSRRELGHSNSNTVGYGGFKCEAPSTTLEMLFKAFDIQNVGLLKMDIESGEFAILPDNLPFLAARNIPILLGVHGPYLEKEHHHLIDELYDAIVASYKNVYSVQNLEQPLTSLRPECSFLDVLITNEDLHNVDIADD